MFKEMLTSLYSGFHDLATKPVAYVMQGDKFVCTNNLSKELEFYNKVNNNLQDSVNRYLELHPGDGEGASVYFNGLLDRDIFGYAWKESRNCLEPKLQAIGQSLDNLPTVITPEYGEIAAGVAAFAFIGAIIAGSPYVRNKLKQTGVYLGHGIGKIAQMTNKLLGYGRGFDYNKN